MRGDGAGVGRRWRRERLTCIPLSSLSGFSSCLTLGFCSNSTKSALPLVGWSLNLEYASASSAAAAAGSAGAAVVLEMGRSVSLKVQVSGAIKGSLSAVYSISNARADLIA